MNADILKQVKPSDAYLIIKAAGLRRNHEEILKMRYVDDLSCYEIAEIKHVEVETARNMVWKARKQFEKYTS